MTMEPKTDSFTWIVIGAIVVFLAIAIGTRFQQSPANSAATYSTTDTERPMLALSERNFDLGEMAVDDEKTQAVELKNTGLKPLVISNFQTSCDCTFAQMVMASGEKSPEFTMHGINSWTGTIEPGESAILNIIYRPAIMPVKGKVERMVGFATNDPENKTVEMMITATVK